MEISPLEATPRGPARFVVFPELHLRKGVNTETLHHALSDFSPGNPKSILTLLNCFSPVRQTHLQELEVNQDPDNSLKSMFSLMDKRTEKLKNIQRARTLGQQVEDIFQNNPQGVTPDDKKTFLTLTLSQLMANRYVDHDIQAISSRVLDTLMQERTSSSAPQRVVKRKELRLSPQLRRRIVGTASLLPVAASLASCDQILDVNSMLPDVAAAQTTPIPKEMTNVEVPTFTYAGAAEPSPSPTPFTKPTELPTKEPTKTATKTEAPTNTSTDIAKETETATATGDMITQQQFNNMSGEERAKLSYKYPGKLFIGCDTSGFKSILEKKGTYGTSIKYDPYGHPNDACVIYGWGPKKFEEYIEQWLKYLGISGTQKWDSIKKQCKVMSRTFKNTTNIDTAKELNLVVDPSTQQCVWEWYDAPKEPPTATPTTSP